MDVIEAGVLAFVAFIFIGGTMAYVAGPPDALPRLQPDMVQDDVCKFEDCDGEPAKGSGSEDDDEDEKEEKEDRGGKKGKGRGKD